MKDNSIMRDLGVEFEEFYKENLNLIIKHVYHKVKDVHIAEDIAQETFYLAFVKWEQVKESPVPLRWLYQTANYKLMELYRKTVNYPTIPLEEAVDVAVTDEAKHEVTELEMTATDTLTKEEWLLLRKYHIEGFLASELAEEMGITPNNVRVRISRLTGKLRRTMEK